jgi:hypothetical protein
VTYYDDALHGLRLAIGDADGPGLLYQLERRFWIELWRTPPPEAVEECGIQTRQYGPMQATVIAEAGRTPQLNLLLGASDPGAVAGGHLEEALDWIESIGVDCRIPIRPELAEAEAAEELLDQRGYERTASLVRFVRDASPPDFPEPAGTEVDEFPDETEGFSDYIVDGFGMEWPSHTFFDGLPGRRRWRSYAAIGADELGIGAATMMLHYGVAQFGFAATREEDRGKGGHMALLRRRILDAAAAGSRRLFADTEEPRDDPEAPSFGARNLVRAGFKQASVRPVWRSPLPPAEDQDDGYADEDPYEDDHEFDLED